MDTKNPRGRKLLVGEATTLLNLWTPQWSTTDVGWVTVGTNVLAYCRVSSRASQSSFTAVQLTFKSRPAVDVSKELSKSFSCNSHNLSSESCVIFKTFSSSIGHVLLELLATLLQYPPPPPKRQLSANFQKMFWHMDKTSSEHRSSSTTWGSANESITHFLVHSGLYVVWFFWGEFTVKHTETWDYSFLRGCYKISGLLRTKWCTFDGWVQAVNWTALQITPVHPSLPDRVSLQRAAHQV